MDNFLYPSVKPYNIDKIMCYTPGGDTTVRSKNM